MTFDPLVTVTDGATGRRFDVPRSVLMERRAKELAAIGLNPDGTPMAALTGDVVFPEPLYVPTTQDKELNDLRAFAKAAGQVIDQLLAERETPDNSTHNRLTACLRCGRVYGPGMKHRC